MTDELASSIPVHPSSSLTPSEQRVSRFFFVLLFLISGVATAAIAVIARMTMTVTRYHALASWQYAFIGVIVVVALYAFVSKMKHRLFWEVIFTATLFLGVWYALLLILPFWLALTIASVLTLAELLVRNVMVHNIFYVLGAAGVAIDFAGWLPSDVLLAGLVALTLYDMVAGPPGGPVEKLASELLRVGIVPGVILPTRAAQLRMDVDRVLRTNAALLGAGDLILPLCLVAKAGFSGVGSASAVIGGLVVGAIVLGRTTDLHPRAALPALAAGAAVPFILLRLFGRV